MPLCFVFVSKYFCVWADTFTLNTVVGIFIKHIYCHLYNQLLMLLQNFHIKPSNIINFNKNFYFYWPPILTFFGKSPIYYLRCVLACKTFHLKLPIGENFSPILVCHNPLHFMKWNVKNCFVKLILKYKNFDKLKINILYSKSLMT